MTFETMLNPGTKPAGNCYDNATENHGRGEKDAIRLSRRSDPVTSFQAAEQLRKSGKLRGQRKAVLAVLRLIDGATSAEISAKIGTDRYVASRRLPELERMGLVTRGQIRFCTVTKNRCLSWWILNND